MKRLFVFLAGLIIFAPLFAQTSGEEAVSPHVSQISAEVKNNFIRLTWVDSGEAQGQVYIFRSARPFSETIPPNSRPVIVPYGTQYYVDDTEEIENLYYFIAASDTSGNRFDTIIPRINSISMHLTQTAEPGIASYEPEPPVQESVPQQAAAQGSAAQIIPGISNLKARQENDKVIITYDVFGPSRNIVLYRSMQPVSRPQDLLNAVIVQSGIAAPFVDFPIPGLSWYYAAIYEDEISSGNMGIRPGRNATTTAVILSGGETAERALRPIPLPYMTLRNAIPEGDTVVDVPEQSSLNSALLNMLQSAQMPQKIPLPSKKPRIFAVDLKSPSGGEESALFQIVQEYFEKRDWDNSRIALLHYLSLPRSTEVEARARFYLGQTWYFTGNYREALFEFLSVQNLHPIEANIWIDAILAAMVH
jgi:hypothetical protein